MPVPKPGKLIWNWNFLSAQFRDSLSSWEFFSCGFGGKPQSSLAVFDYAAGKGRCDKIRGTTEHKMPPYNTNQPNSNRGAFSNRWAQGVVWESGRPPQLHPWAHGCDATPRSHPQQPCPCLSLDSWRFPFSVPPFPAQLTTPVMPGWRKGSCSPFPQWPTVRRHCIISPPARKQIWCLYSIPAASIHFPWPSASGREQYCLLLMAPSLPQENNLIFLLNRLCALAIWG